MSPKHIPMRTCIGCRTVKPKKELIRIVRTPESVIEIDKTGKKSGRGAYVCPNMTCLHKAIKGTRLDKALNTQISLEVKQKLEKQLND